MVCFPLGMVSLFTVTPPTPCRLERLGVSAFECPPLQVCVVTHALTGLSVHVQSCPQTLIKRLFMFLQHLCSHLSSWSYFAFLFALLSFHVGFMSTGFVNATSFASSAAWSWISVCDYRCTEKSLSADPQVRSTAL